MPIRIPMHAIVIQRDGKNMIPEVGKPFEFTEQELADIKAVKPDAIRLPINEAATQAAAVQLDNSMAELAEKSKAKTAAKADGEL